MGVDDKNNTKKARKAASKVAKQLVNSELKLSSIASEKVIKKARKIRENHDRMENRYLQCLIDPFSVKSAKIPDDLTYPSTTFFIHQNFDVTTDTSGGFVGLFSPWPNSLILANATNFAGGSGNLYSWINNTWIVAAKNSMIQQQFAMARPVAMGVRIRYTGAVLEAAGELTGALYDPVTTMPTNYTDLAKAPEYQKFAISSDTASATFIWKPLCAAQSRDYMPVTYWTVPQGGYNFWVPTGAATNALHSGPGAWVFIPNGASSATRAAPLGFPFLVIGGKGLPISKTCIDVEVIAHFEATVQSQTLSMGSIEVGVSHSRPKQLTEADTVVAQMPVGFPTHEKQSWIEKANGFLTGVGSVVDTVASTAGKIAPVLAALL